MKQPSTVMIPHSDKIQGINLAKGGISAYRRDTVGMQKNVHGILEERDVDYPRRFYRGDYASYLSEADATNNFLWNDDYSNAVHFKSNTVIVSSDTEVAPNGKLDADLLSPLTEGSSNRYIQQNISLSNQEYTFSVYLKYKGQKDVRLSHFNSNSPYTDYSQATFDLVEGEVSNTAVGSANIEDAGNGWWRVSITGTSTLSGSQAFRVSLGTTSSESGSTEDGVLIWGGQVDEGISPTSVIITDGSAKDRGYDNFFFSSSSNLGGHFAFYSNIKLFKTGDALSMFTLTGGTTDDRVQVRSQPNSTSIMIVVSMDGELFTDILDVGGYDNDVKIAFTFNDNLMRVSLNGEIASIYTFTNLAFSNLDRVINSNISSIDNSTKFKGLISEVMLFPMSLSDAEANYITS